QKVMRRGVVAGRMLPSTSMSLNPTSQPRPELPTTPRLPCSPPRILFSKDRSIGSSPNHLLKARQGYSVPQEKTAVLIQAQVSPPAFARLRSLKFCKVWISFHFSDLSLRRPVEQAEGEQMTRRIVVLIAASALASGVCWKIYAQSAVPVFTPAQSDAGRTAYAQNCASCHGDNLDDGQFGPALRGNEFRTRWSDKTLDELFTYVSTKMPPDRAGALENKTYATLLAYLLEANGIQPGNRELSTEQDQLRTLTLPRQVPST